MSPACGRCGAAELPPASRFCLHCGAPLAEPEERAAGAGSSYTPPHLESVLASGSARDGERKDVTVLVADVAGSLAMAHRLDPEDLHALMQGFFSLAMEAVHAEHGTLNQFRGDGFMALFGAPRARAGHALHAVRAALEVRRRAEDYGESVRARYGVPLVLRMGVHTGPVWVGAIGGDLRRDYTVEGPTAGIAVRLEQAAGPGRILVSEQTAQRLGALVELRALGTFEAHGAPEPLAAFEVLARGRYETAFDAERARGLAPFAGRSSELAKLASSLAPVAPGTARWVEIVGEPGVGKSRLAHELRTRDGGAWLEGRAHEQKGAHAYAFWLDLLGRWSAAGDPPADAPALARQLEGREGSPEPPACESALRRLLESAPGEGPVTILVEDAQWIDGSSLRLARRLLDEPPARGVRFLATVRPEGVPPTDASWPGERLVLGALDREHALQIALAVLAGSPDPEPLAALAAERGGGNPLFVLELARALREGDDELRASARLETAWRRTPARLPATLRDVIASRIDALPAPEKRALQVAAVIGRGFPRRFLERIAGDDEASLGERSAALVERGLLVESGDQLDFAHALHREVAYEQMLRGRRRELHRRCAAVLEAEGDAGAPARAAEIGLHHDRAGEAARAARAYARAGEGHLALFAAREAAVQLRRAWEIANESRQAVDANLSLRIALALARALNTLDRAEEAGAVLEALGPAGAAGEDRARLAEAWIESAWVRFCAGAAPARTLALLERGMELAAGKVELEARAHAYRIRICHLDGAIGRAAESARRVVEIATGAGERFGVVFGLGNEGYVRCDAGEIERAHRLCAEACALAREPRHEVALALASGWLAKAQVFRGDGEAALETAAEARELGSRSGQVSAVYNADLWTGAAWLLLGQPKRAAQAFERLAETNDSWSTTRDWLALACLETGRFDEAIELARGCLASEPPRLVRLRALRTLGRALALARREEGDPAERALGEALGLALELELRPHAAETFFALADLCRRQGHEKRAAYYADRATSTFEACGMATHARLARAELR
jgi:class 3 adenylate cyclase